MALGTDNVVTQGNAACVLKDLGASRDRGAVVLDAPRAVTRILGVPGERKGQDLWDRPLAFTSDVFSRQTVGADVSAVQVVLGSVQTIFWGGAFCKTQLRCRITLEAYNRGGTGPRVPQEGPLAPLSALSPGTK